MKCVISYDGTNFSGLQIQPRNRTIQGEMEKALAKIHKGEHIRVYASGRTDKGVHAKAQTLHFESDYTLSPADWKRALNTVLPPDIYVNDAAQVPDSFHARFDVIEKEYRYYIFNELEPDVFKQHYVYHYPYTLDVAKMQESGQYFEGLHDFTTFSSAKADIKGSKIRHLYEVSCHHDGSRIEFILRGNGFLYNMARIIVGTLLDVGRGKRQPSEIEELFGKKERQSAGDTVPPQGLYLWNVKYEER
ncbi:tRNA pseudouridine(38-40) synthase TruA [Lentibacillus halodurans]